MDILYRGPLESCNYDCGYCPFAKTQHTKLALREDALALRRFVAWAQGWKSQPLSVLFTPWGEAMHLAHYQEALVTLSQAPHVLRVGIQTNGTGPLGFLEDACLKTLRLWMTYHPSEVGRDEFVARSKGLSAKGVKHSVGLVGRPDYVDEAEALRAALDPSTYVWVNAYRDPALGDQPAAAALADDVAARFAQIDPWFELNLRGLAGNGHGSLGRPCSAGSKSVSVDGNGDIRRCHFVGEVVGNLYGPGLGSLDSAGAGPEPCPNAVCDCHIGYVHRPDIAEAMRGTFGAHALLRIPEESPVP